MVCSFGSGRMAVMARLLAAENCSQNVTEDVGRKKSAAQLIFKELSEAVEPNLLDEEDMHVFGLKPMADPLLLVCCNTCKKPVKTSQYTAHAEVCKMLKSTEQSKMDVDNSVRHKKPTKKERKKPVTAYANQVMPVQELERSVSVGANAIEQSQLNGQIAMNSSFPMEAKTLITTSFGTSAYVDSKTSMDTSGVNPGNNNNCNSTGVKPRPTKRSKMNGGNELQPSVHVSLKGTVLVGCLNDDGVGYKKNEQVHEHCLPIIKDVPAPLATKIYYSQRSNRLRSAISHLYNHNETVASSNEIRSDAMNPELSNGNAHVSHTMAQKTGSLYVPSLQISDQILEHSSDMYLGTSGVCSPPSDFSKQLPLDNTPRPQVTSGGLARNKYLPKPYSFTGNSGQSLGSVQQKNGSVPVL